ncbi:hypothetical protein [Desulfotalea psychrophila]|uniref:Uncharacterized protein n=1 Tax=Desulfotalea psychrophila (strain LSv54 / DSM 12343) TaxID=177439 RepID=Q6AJJ7_DESPS|nr:hypothetical protein [Desulfotalea psychrophila]CAG37483.1 unknown protein [Desulfotalea psychrophila LSv54]
MANSFLLRFKPGVKRKVHLAVAAMLWTFMGVFLFYRGMSYIEKGHSSYLIIILAIISGSLKSYLILDRAARRSIQRILLLNDGTCLGAVYSWKTWGLVFCMAFMGILLRMSLLPSSYLAFFCCTIGWSLFFSSRYGWRAWLQNR